MLLPTLRTRHFFCFTGVKHRFLMCYKRRFLDNIEIMSYDPLSEVTDEPLLVSAQTVPQLLQLRESVKFTDLPGTDTAEEQARLSKIFNEMLDSLIAGVTINQSKLWVMSQFQPALEAVQVEDTEGREHFGSHIEQIMDILNIESSDGLLSFYL